MSLNSAIDSKYKEPTARVRFNSNTTRDLLGINVNLTLEGGIGSASVRTQSNPSVNPEARVQIFQGYNGDNRLTFTGYVDSVEPNEGDGTYTINCRDVLKKALDTFLIQEIKFGQDIAAGQYYYSTYTSTAGGTFTIHQYASLAALNAAHPETTGNYSSQGVKAEAVVQWLLHMSGLAEGTEIQVDETNFWIGDINPAKFHLTSVYDAAMQIANLIGWRIYADAAGIARFKKKPRQPGGYTYWRYTDKASPYNIDKLTKTSTNVDLRNYVEVRGASGIRVVKRAASPFIGNTPYRGVLISEELIDTPGIADFIATRVLQDLNRLKVTVALEVDGNPFLTPGSTLDVSSRIANGKFLVDQYQTNETSDGGYRANISAVAYLGDTVFEEDPEADIVAVFTPVFVSVLGDPKWVVEFDGAASYSSRGVITQYDWTWPDSTTTSSSSSNATFVFDEAAISNGNSQNVTLQVYDAQGNTASVTQAITTSGLTALVTPKYRALYGALTTQAVGSIDGGQTWFTNSIPAISVAASNFGPGGVYVTSGHALFGTSDNKIYKTIDTCLTMTEVYAADGDVIDVHIPELDSTKAAAVTDTGKVLYSDDSGDTWRQIGSFAFALRQVKMNYTNFKELTIVGSGTNNVWITTDTGASWANLGVGSYDVLWATDGSQTNYFAHTNGVLGSGPAGVAALTFSGGGSVAVPAATVMIDRDDGVMIVDVNGQHWVASAGQFGATQNNSANKTQHMIRDGEMATVGYYATASGISKSLNRNQTIQELYYPAGSMPANGWGRKVAYGPLASILLPTQLVYRGEVNTAGTAFNGSPTDGFHLATSSGWIYQVPNDMGGNLSVTAGAIAIGESGETDGTPGYLHLIKCVAASGAGQVAIGRLELHTNWNRTASNFICTVAFNRRSDSRDMLCTILEDDAVAGQSTLDAESFPAFISTENGSSIFQNIAGPGFVRDKQVQNVTSPLGDMVFRYNYTLFGPDNYVDVTFLPSTITLSDTTVQNSDNDLYAPQQKASAEFKGIVKHDGSIKLATGQSGGTLLFEDLNIPEDDILHWNSGPFEPFNPEIYGSYVDQSRLYYATEDGIYTVQNYGQAEPEALFTAASVNPSGVIIGMRVTADSSNINDYLTVVVGGYPNTGLMTTRHCFYSTDSGDSWIEGPIMYNSDTADLWVIDPLTTTAS